MGSVLANRSTLEPLSLGVMGEVSNSHRRASESPLKDAPPPKPCMQSHTRSNLKSRLWEMYWEGNVFSWCFQRICLLATSTEQKRFEIVGESEHSIWEYPWQPRRGEKTELSVGMIKRLIFFWHCQFSSIKLAVLYRWWCGHWEWLARKGTRLQWKKGGQTGHRQVSNYLRE